MVVVEWSSYQRAVFEEVGTGSGHLVIVARAGCGKTTTIVEGMKYVPVGSRVLFCAFGKGNQEDLAGRVPDGVDARTTHSLGFAAVRQAMRKVVGTVEVDKYRANGLLRPRLDVLHDAVETEINQKIDRRGSLAKFDFGAARKLISLAKSALVETEDDIVAIAMEHQIWGGYLDLEEIAKLVLEVLQDSKEPSAQIDFDDMLWLPVVMDYPLPQYDFVFVDEVQDLNACQLALVRRMCRGRIIAVGDDRQAIYRFRGASRYAFDSLIGGDASKVLSLPVCYRCDAEIIKKAQAVVPDIEAAPGAAPGMVRETSRLSMQKHARPGDFVLSRTNAGAVAACLSLLKGGIRARVAGKDIGKSILDLVDRAKGLAARSTISGFLQWLRDWESKAADQVVKRCASLGRDPESALDGLKDRAEVVRVIANVSETVGDLRRRSKSLFEDSVWNQIIGRETFVVCSTVHKAKGKEADQVWLLVGTFKWSRADREEANIWYVALTRARHSLCLVSTSRNDDDYEEIEIGMAGRLDAIAQAWAVFPEEGSPALEDVDESGLRDDVDVDATFAGGPSKWH